MIFCPRNVSTVGAIGFFALLAPAGAQETVAYTYDGYGRLIAVSRTSGGQPTPNNSGPDSSVSTVATGVDVGNFSFELPNLGSGVAVDPVAAGSSFTGVSGVAANGSALGFNSAPDGNQVGFVKSGDAGPSTIALAVSGLTAGGRYKVRFSVARRGGQQNPVIVDFNGTPLGTFLPSSANFEQVVTAAFQPSSSSGTLSFNGTVSSSDESSAIDKVEFLVPGTLDLPGGSFEQPNLNGGYAYNPSAPGTVFTGKSGIAANGSSWGFSPASDGNQVAFIESFYNNPGSIALSLSGLTAGNEYKISFRLAQWPAHGAVPISVFYNGVSMGTFTPGSTNFEPFTTSSFLVTASTGTITFSGGAADGDTASAIDSVRVDAL